MDWAVLPGRKVAHRFRGGWEGRYSASCGCCASYTLDRLREASPHTRRCEQCLIAEASGYVGAEERFVFGRIVSPETKQARRDAWRAYRVSMGWPVKAPKVPFSRTQEKLRRKLLWRFNNVDSIETWLGIQPNTSAP